MKEIWIVSFGGRSAPKSHYFLDEGSARAWDSRPIDPPLPPPCNYCGEPCHVEGDPLGEEQARRAALRGRQT